MTKQNERYFIWPDNQCKKALDNWPDIEQPSCHPSRISIYIYKILVYSYKTYSLNLLKEEKLLR